MLFSLQFDAVCAMHQAVEHGVGNGWVSDVLVPEFDRHLAGHDGSRPPIWFAFGDDRPLSFFAGIWTPWAGVRKVKEGPVEVDVFGFLTTEPNALVGAYYPKAMPVILTTPAECDMWMTAPALVALELQRPLGDEALVIVARGGKEARAADDQMS